MTRAPAPFDAQEIGDQQEPEGHVLDCRLGIPVCTGAGLGSLN